MNILLIDDHALYREGLKMLLSGLDGACQVIEASCCEGGLAALREQGELSLALLDLGLGDGNDRLSCLRRLRRADPTLPVVIVSAHESSATVQAALAEGANGYILKSSATSTVLEALQCVLAGGVYIPPSLAFASDEVPGKLFTKRQQEVLELMAQGEPNKAIAKQLGTAEGTVRIHVTAIIKILEAANRTEAVSKAIRLGYVAAFSEN